MLISRRNFLKAVGASAVALSTAGCSNPLGGGDIELKLISRWGDDTNRAVEFRKMVDSFNGKYEGITVVPEYITDSDTYDDKIRTIFATGQDYHVYQSFGAASAAPYVKNDLIVDLEPYMAEYPEWGDLYDDMFLEKYRYADHAGTYAVPLERYCIAMYYNKDIFAECGVQPATTFDEFEELCEALLAKGYVPLALGAFSTWRIAHIATIMMLRTYGAASISALADRSLSYDSPEMLEIFERIQNYANLGYFGSSPVTMDVVAERAGFLTTDSLNAMHMDQNAYTDDINASEITDSIGVVPWPYINEEYKGSWLDSGSGYAVIKSGNEKVDDAAVKLLMHISGEDFFKNYYIASSGALVPVPLTGIEDVKVTPIFAEFTAMLTDQKEAKDEAAVYDSITSIQTTVRTELQGLFVDKSPADVAAAIIADIDNNS